MLDAHSVAAGGIAQDMGRRTSFPAQKLGQDVRGLLRELVNEEMAARQRGMTNTSALRGTERLGSHRVRHLQTRQGVHGNGLSEVVTIDRQHPLALAVAPG